MIPVTKDEARILRELYPEYRASTNHRTAELVAQFDRRKELNRQRLIQQGEL